jgi:hypothetical protein
MALGGMLHIVTFVMLCEAFLGIEPTSACGDTYSTTVWEWSATDGRRRRPIDPK